MKSESDILLRDLTYYFISLKEANSRVDPTVFEKLTVFKYLDLTINKTKPF